MTEKNRDGLLTEGFAAPILWGVEQGCSVKEIAHGLEITEFQVIRALEAYAPQWFSLQIRAAWVAPRLVSSDPANVWAWRNWFRSTAEATRLLAHLGD